MRPILGVEPEPFEQGEHLVAASGKLLILDVLLSFLKKRGHKVLLFSQMTRMLDIIQDYLAYRSKCHQLVNGIHLNYEAAFRSFL